MFAHKRGRVAAGVIALGLTAALAACSSGNPLDSGKTGTPADNKTIIIGSQGFAESDILAQLYGQVLAANGYDVSYAPGIGSRETFIPALKDGSIDFIPDYAGNLLYGADPKATATSKDDVVAALPAALKPLGLAALDAAAAEDSDALVVTPEFAAANKLKTIGDLAPLSATVTLGANTEFEGRWRAGLSSTYGFTGFAFKAIDDYGGPGTLSDLLANNIQVADIYTTTPSIKQNKLVVLDDDKNLFAAQNVIPLLNANFVTDGLSKLLNEVSAKLTTDDLLTLNETSAGADKPSPAKVAGDWLKDKGLLK